MMVLTVGSGWNAVATVQVAARADPAVLKACVREARLGAVRDAVCQRRRVQRL